MKRTRLVIAFLVGFCAGLLVGAGRSTAQSLPASAVSVDTVMQRLQEHQDLFLVDVRNPHEFERVNIPGSLNIPLFANKTKAFLKHKPLILIDEGYSLHRMENACKQLKQAGFDARFLFGGLNAWHTKSAKESLQRSAKESLQRSAKPVLPPLQGDVFAQKALNKMPPQALFAEQNSEYWLLIDVSTSGEACSPGSAGETPALPWALPEGDLFSQAISVPFDPKNPKQFLSNFEDIIAYSEWRLVLLYNRHGQDYEELERLLQNTDVNTVFFLEGGANAYTRFVAQQTQINQGQQNLTTTCSACAR